MIKKYRKAVFIVVYRKNTKNNSVEYLLLKRKLHWKGWEFPKGGIDKGEKPIQTAKRETMEETGLKPIIIKKYSVSGKYRYPKFLDDRPNNYGQTYRLFSAEVEEKNIKLKLDPKEHSGFKWLPYSEAVKKLTWPNQRKCLGIVNRSLRL